MSRELTLTFTITIRSLGRAALAGAIVAIPPNLRSEPRDMTLSATYPSPTVAYGRLVTTGLEGPSYFNLTGGHVGIGVPEGSNPVAQLTVRQTGTDWNTAIVLEEDPANRSAIYGKTGRLLIGRPDGVGFETRAAGFSNGGMTVGHTAADTAPPVNGLRVQGAMGIGSQAGAGNDLVVAGTIGDAAAPACQWRATGLGLIRSKQAQCGAAAGEGWVVVAWEAGGGGLNELINCPNGACAPTFNGNVLCCRFHPDN